LLPGIQNARAAARRIQCENNMRNVSTAMHSYYTANNGRLPWLITNPAVVGSLYSVDPVAAAPVPVPWSVQLLPYLEQQSLFDRFTTPNPPLTGPDSIAELRRTVLSIYTCPDDPNAESGGTMTHVANAGLTTRSNWVAALAGTSLNGLHYAGVDGSGVGYDYSFNDWTGANADDLDVTQANGLFWQEAFNGGYRSRIDSMKDGQSNTVILTESLQATNWWAFNINQVGYVVPMEDTGTANQFASNETALNGLGPDPGNAYSVKSNALRYAPDASAAIYNGINFSGDATLQQSRINNNTGAAEGLAPRPASLHPGVVNAFFGDGHGRTISQNINDIVWFNITTPSGQRFGENIQGENF
jgi:hypothetical protein